MDYSKVCTDYIVDSIIIGSRETTAALHCGVYLSIPSSTHSEVALSAFTSLRSHATTVHQASVPPPRRREESHAELLQTHTAGSPARREPSGGPLPQNSVDIYSQSGIWESASPGTAAGSDSPPQLLLRVVLKRRCGEEEQVLSYHGGTGGSALRDCCLFCIDGAID